MRIKNGSLIVLSLTMVMMVFAVTASFASDSDFRRGEERRTHEERQKTFKEQLKSEIMEELKEREGILAKLAEHFTFGLLIEFGGAYEDTSFKDGSSEDGSDFALYTMELAIGVELNEWVSGEVVFLYEDGPFDEETSVDLDVGAVIIGNTEKFPLYITGGQLYVPFGALYTHFPEDPLTLELGETREAALVAGLEIKGFHLAGYVFNGDVDEQGNDNNIESFGADAKYVVGDAEKDGYSFTVGVSYISNIADSDGISDALELESIKDYVGGFDAYFHGEYAGFFLLAEYMTAIDEFDAGELADNDGNGAQSSVWNIEAGYNWNWGKNTEFVLGYAGSDEAGGLGLPESRIALGVNQELFEGVTFSLAYWHDEFDDNDADGRDDRNLVFSYLTIEF